MSHQSPKIATTVAMQLKAAIESHNNSHMTEPTLVPRRNVPTSPDALVDISIFILCFSTIKIALLQVHTEVMQTESNFKGAAASISLERSAS